jgi:hypothetical protein
VRKFQIFIKRRVSKPFLFASQPRNISVFCSPTIYFSFSLFTIALLAANNTSLSRYSYHFNPIEDLASVATPFDTFDPPLDPSPPQG